MCGVMPCNGKSKNFFKIWKDVFVINEVHFTYLPWKVPQNGKITQNIDIKMNFILIQTPNN